MIHLVDVFGGRMWHVNGQYLWTKKDAASYIRATYNGDKKHELLNQLKEHTGKACAYGI